MHFIKDVLKRETFLRAHDEIQGKFDDNCWRSSLWAYPESQRKYINQSTMITSVSSDLEKVIWEEVGEYFPEGFAVRMEFLAYQCGSGLSFHKDNQLATAQIVLNKTWDPDWGGCLIWEDEETENDGVHKALFPRSNAMLIVDDNEKYAITPISPHAPEFRVCINIICYPTIDLPPEVRNYEETHKDSVHYEEGSNNT
tara:strand:+ start:67 stop:660 length:594 start_codon:yes stop_codon:yes gene_type:complete